MQIVINIPEEEYQNYLKMRPAYPKGVFCYIKAIQNGTPLLNGHGKIIDVQNAVDNLMEYKEIGIFGNHDKRTILGCIDRIENHVEPIIKADKLERSEE